MTQQDSIAITPTVGRKVWYRPSWHDISGTNGMATIGGQPLDATIVAVWSDTMVNLVVFDANGNMYRRTSVPLKQNDQFPPISEGFAYCEWMPYQRSQAAK